MERTKTAWQLACLWIRKDQNSSRQPRSSRQRHMLACAASLCCMIVLEELKEAKKSISVTGKHNSRNSEKRSAKRQRRSQNTNMQNTLAETEQQLEDPKAGRLIHELVQLANKQGPYTRGTTVRPWKDSVNLTVEQVAEEVVSLFAHLVRTAKKLNGYTAATSADAEKISGKRLTLSVEHNVTERINDLLKVDIDTFINILPQIFEHMREGDAGRISYINELELIECSSLEGFVKVSTFEDPKNPISPSTTGDSDGKDTDDVPSLVVHPPLMTETMEFNEWAFSLLNLEIVKPSKQLLALLASTFASVANWRDAVFQILNDTLLHLHRAVTNSKASVVQVGMESHDLGQVKVSTGATTEANRLCRAFVAFYYHALESILSYSVNNTRAVPVTIVFSEGFQRSILACCCACVMSATDMDLQVPSPSELWHAQGLHAILITTHSNPLDFFNVINYFLKSLSDESTQVKLGSPLIAGLPRILHKHLLALVSSALDCVLWSKEFPQFLDAIGKMKQSSKWPPPSFSSSVPSIEDYATIDYLVESIADNGGAGVYRSVDYIFRTILNRAHSRLKAICNYLNLSGHSPITKEIWGAFLHLLRNNCEEIRGRHLDQWLLCSIYGVSRSMRYIPEIKFTNIIDAYIAVRGAELGESTCQQIVRCVRLNDDSSSPGDIIALYNKRFVPLLKDHLLSAKMLKSSSAEI